MIHTILQGDCFEVLKTLEANSVDSLVTDPPAGISFMGKDWDEDFGGREPWIKFMLLRMRECYRVLKPGAHGLVWAIPRTSHWTASALELAGFEIRDVVTHLFGTGFPKSLDISKAIDKAAGVEREITGYKKLNERDKIAYTPSSASHFGNKDENQARAITAPATDAAKQWQGWGTALKPASEHWILVRKPLAEKTVAANVMKFGVGGINVDACRIGVELVESGRAGRQQNAYGVMEVGMKPIGFEPKVGRFPANLVLSHNDDCDETCSEGCAVAMLDAQSGLKCGAAAPVKRKLVPETTSKNHALPKFYVGDDGVSFRNETGGASRFFYCAKASKSDREAGLEHLPEFDASIGDDRPSGQSMQRLDGRSARKARNTHPTVKSTKLMSYLIKLVTPPNGTVLDPFTGSGSTGVAAVKDGFSFIGVEQDPAYVQIAEKRISAEYDLGF